MLNPAYSVPVKNISEERSGSANSRYTGVPLDKVTHQRGCIFELFDFRWVNDNKILIQVYVHWGRLAGYGGTYPLVRQGNSWIVKQPTNAFEE
jgi:hypothetical protein